MGPRRGVVWLQRCVCLLVHGWWWLGGVCICVQVAAFVYTGWGWAGVYIESFTAGMHVGVQTSCTCLAMYVQMCVCALVGAYSGMCADMDECVWVPACECT